MNADSNQEFKPVGTIFIENGKALQVVEASGVSCQNCYYKRFPYQNCLYAPRCTSGGREDKKYVIFKQISSD